jgi:hypothetical protein
METRGGAGEVPPASNYLVGGFNGAASAALDSNLQGFLPCHGFL